MAATLPARCCDSMSRPDASRSERTGRLFTNVSFEPRCSFSCAGRSSQEIGGASGSGLPFESAAAGEERVSFDIGSPCEAPRPCEREQVVGGGPLVDAGEPTSFGGRRSQHRAYRLVRARPSWPVGAANVVLPEVSTGGRLNGSTPAAASGRLCRRRWRGCRGRGERRERSLARPRRA